MERLTSAYGQVRLGDPLETSTLCGPLHSPQAVDAFLQSIKESQEQGGKVGELALSFYQITIVSSIISIVVLDPKDLVFDLRSG